MPFAEDKVKEYINNNLKKFQDRVRVNQMLYLRCFTDVDRQEIHAFEQLHGNNLAFWKFFEHLRARQGWVQLFIEALRNDQLGDLAEELQRVYELYQLPPPRRNTSSPAASGQAAQLPGTGTGATSYRLAPAAGAQLSPRQNLPLSSGALPPCPFDVDAPRLASSATTPAVSDGGDCSAPVQETELLSRNSEMTLRPEAMHDTGKGEPFTSPTEATASSSKKPTDGQATSPTSASSGPSGQAVEVSFPSTPVVSLRPGAGSLTHRWDRGQQHPPPEGRGFSGNGNCVKDSGPSPSLAAAPNQPEENYYTSADSSPWATGSPEEQLGEGWLKERTVQALPGNQNRKLSGNPLGANASPSQLQPWFGRGQGGALGSRGSEKNVDMGDLGEIPNVDPASKEPGNLQPRSNTDRVPGDVAPWVISGVPPLGTSPSHQPRLLTSPVGNGSTFQMPAAAPVLHPPASDQESYSSTDVIPPHSPLGSSDFASDVTKFPIQEKKLSFVGPRGTHATLPTWEKVPSATVDRSTVNFVRKKNDRIFDSNCDDDSLCKPEILMSHPDDPPVGLLGQQPSLPEATPEYSGRTERFRCSGSGFSLGSDSLQRSDSSCSGMSGESCPNQEGGSVLGRNMTATAALDASRQPSVGIQQENGSIRTFMLSFKQEASVDVAGAPNGADLDGASSPSSPDVLSSSASGRQRISGAGARCDGSQVKEKAGTKPSSMPNNDLLVLAGISALLFATLVGFLLLKRK